MATRRKAVNRSIIRTRSSSSSKPPKHKQSERHDHQETAPTQQELASSAITAATTDQHKLPCSPSPTEKVGNYSWNKSGDEDQKRSCNWSTPRAKRFRIPEIESCPPAPKKQRASNSGTTNGSNNVVSLICAGVDTNKECPAMKKGL